MTNETLAQLENVVHELRMIEDDSLTDFQRHQVHRAERALAHASHAEALTREGRCLPRTFA